MIGVVFLQRYGMNSFTATNRSSCAITNTLVDRSPKSLPAQKRPARSCADHARERAERVVPERCELIVGEGEVLQARGRGERVVAPSWLLLRMRYHRLVSALVVVEVEGREQRPPGECCVASRSRSG